MGLSSKEYILRVPFLKPQGAKDEMVSEISPHCGANQEGSTENWWISLPSIFTKVTVAFFVSTFRRA